MGCFPPCCSLGLPAHARSRPLAATGERALDRYSERTLARDWNAERFSWWFTGVTHRFPHMDDFDRRMQIAELAYIGDSRAAQTAPAETYVGLPLA